MTRIFLVSLIKPSGKTKPQVNKSLEKQTFVCTETCASWLAKLSCNCVDFRWVSKQWNFCAILRARLRLIKMNASCRKYTQVMAKQSHKSTHFGNFPPYVQLRLADNGKYDCQVIRPDSIASNYSYIIPLVFLCLRPLDRKLNRIVY